MLGEEDINNLASIDIKNLNGSFKSTYEIIKELGDVWNNVLCERKEITQPQIQDNLVKYGIYKHFKDKDYVVIDVAQKVEDEVLETWIANNSYNDFLEPKYTEDDRILMVINKDDKYYFSNNFTGGDKVVLYKPLYDDKCGLYARDYNMFLSEVDHEKYPNIKQKWRFQLIK